MNLKHLKWNACPTCQSRVVAEEQRSQHCNGEWFESQTFECGCHVRHVPNFSENQFYELCPKSKEAVEFAVKREDAKKKLTRYVNRLDVDEDFKEVVLRWVP